MSIPMTVWARARRVAGRRRRRSPQRRTSGASMSSASRCSQPTWARTTRGYGCAVVHINTREEDIAFRDQVGYWLWEKETGLVLQSLTIPRGQAVLLWDRRLTGMARGLAAAVRRVPHLAWADFLNRSVPRTDSVSSGDRSTNGAAGYISDTMQKVRGRDELFQLRDATPLVGCMKPTPNACSDREQRNSSRCGASIRWRLPASNRGDVTATR